MIITEVQLCGICLYTSDLQLGFKQGLSIYLCSDIIIETVDHYVRRQYDVYSFTLHSNDVINKSLLNVYLMYKIKLIN